MSNWIGILSETNGALTTGWIVEGAVTIHGNPGWTTRIGGWYLRRGDALHAADVDGDGAEELVIVSPNGEWIGVLEASGDRLVAGWIGHEWVNAPGARGANGWNLQQGDRFLVADLDGDTRDELVVLSPNGKWIGVLEESGGGLVATWIGHDWVNSPGTTGANGWNLRQGDSFYVADVDGDTRDELIVVSPDGEWIGLLELSGGRLVATWIAHDWVNTPGGTGASGWNLQKGDRFFVGDVDSDTRDELIVVSPSGQWIALLREAAGALQATWIGHDWVNPPGTTGANGWDLKQGDSFYVADVDGDNRDELLVVSANGQWIGLLEESAGVLQAGWIGHDWVNPPGTTGANGWDLTQGDRFMVADVDGDGSDELAVVSPDGQWIGLLEESAGVLQAAWIGHDWVNHPGTGGATGWDLKQADRFIPAILHGGSRAHLVVTYLSSEKAIPHVSQPLNSDILAIHAALLSTGYVLLFGGDEHYRDQSTSESGFDRTRLFDPQSGRVWKIDSPKTDVFCSGHAFLADGRLLVAGGIEKWPEDDQHVHRLDFLGSRAAWIQEVGSSRWTRVADLNSEPGREAQNTGGGRWYPTLLTLADGDVLAVFGHPSQSDTRHRNDTPERYSVGSNSWMPLPPVPGAAAVPYQSVMLNYPRLHVLRDGNIFFATPINGSCGIYDPATGTFLNNSIPSPGSGLYNTSWDAPSVLLPLLRSEGYRERVLFCASADAKRIDLRASSPAWTNTKPRTGAAAGRVRRFCCAVLLPTGEVFVTGGTETANDADAVLDAEIYSPGIDWSTGSYVPGGDSWKTVEAATVPRNYHSVALLMNDGRVVTAGSSENGEPGDPASVGEKRIEIYSPWYVEPGRPRIAWSPGALGYGQRIQITSPDAARIRRVALLRAGSVTHAFDSDQRYVELEFSDTGGNVLQVVGPPNGGVAPPGQYMLWVIDDTAHPCERAPFVRVPSVVRVTSVYFNPPGPDLDSEHVVIVNETGNAVDMTGWTLRDLAEHVFTFPSFVLQDGAPVLVWTKAGTSNNVDLYWGRDWPVWNNTGDTAILRDAGESEISRFSYGG